MDYYQVCHGHTYKWYSQGRSWSASIIKLYDHSYNPLYVYHASCHRNPGLKSLWICPWIVQMNMNL